jgi:hypothetical protein
MGTRPVATAKCHVRDMAFWEMGFVGHVYRAEPSKDRRYEPRGRVSICLPKVGGCVGGLGVQS